MTAVLVRLLVVLALNALNPDALIVRRNAAIAENRVFDADLAALKDPDERKKAAAAERQRLHLAYCRGEIQWKEKAHNPQATGANRSPYGPCPGLFSGTFDGLTK